MSDICWDSWKPEIHATLLFVVKGGHILLIEKKRGHGAGKVNGPGGKLDPGETPLQCALRETHEELLITAMDPRKVAELHFHMSDYPSILCHVFLASDFTGEPTETDEAIPFWAPLEEIPYHRMWADDEIWLPEILAGRSLLGKFSFQNEQVIEKQLTYITFPTS